jgi:Uma2 family endonuclease
MASKSLPTITLDQYIAFDNEAERRGEYLNGHMVEVEAATRNHSAIVANLAREVGLSLKESACRVYTQDLRVYMPAANECAYPDLVITCGREDFAPGSILLNPLALIAVLSPSTEYYDRGTKFAHYRSIPSLREYITIAQDKFEIQQWSVIGHEASVSLAGKWLLNATLTDRTDNLAFASLPLNIPFLEIYRNVFWE